MDISGIMDFDIMPDGETAYEIYYRIGGRTLLSLEQRIFNRPFIFVNCKDSIEQSYSLELGLRFPLLSDGMAHDVWHDSNPDSFEDY